MKKKKKATKKKAVRQGATGRPPISKHGNKEKFNISIDPDLKKFLDKKIENRSDYINSLIRADFDKKTRNRPKRKSNSRSAKVA